jgi:hypothetical protein
MLRNTEYIAHARSYTSLYQPAIAMPENLEKASGETNNSTVKFDATIHKAAIISCDAGKGKRKPTVL